MQALLKRHAIALTLLVLFILPVLVGLLGTWLPGVGFFPSLGYTQLTLGFFDQVLHWPGVAHSIGTSVLSALVSSVGAFIISQFLCYFYFGTPLWLKIQAGLAPLLALPHLAFAIGFSFLIAPSGWILRLFSPWLSGFELPPDWLIINDTYALSLSAALMIKEVPFFLLMSLSAMSHFDVQKTLHIAQSLGYRRSEAWLKLVFCRMYPLLKLPMFAVLSYSFSVVDLSVVLGPSTPATFAVMINRWFNDPEIEQRLLGAAASILLFVFLIALITMVLLLEKSVVLTARHWLVAGPQKSGRCAAKVFKLTQGSPFFMMLLWGISAWAITALVVQSFSQRWRFPDTLPTHFTLKYWYSGWQALGEAIANTLAIGLGAALVSLVMSIAVLQWQASIATRKNDALERLMTALIYVPLLIPQVSFLFGVQVLFIYAGIEGKLWSVIWLHVVFVFPYTYLTLAKVFLEFDERYMSQAMTLSNSFWHSFIKVKLAMLTKPLAFTFATGFAVSSAQYLTTIYAGAGRFETLTTHAVTLASGARIQLTASAALWQMLLPLMIYAAAIAIPAFVFRNRKAM